MLPNLSYSVNLSKSKEIMASTPYFPSLALDAKNEKEISKRKVVHDEIFARLFDQCPVKCEKRKKK